MYQIVSNYLGTVLNVLSVLIFAKLVLRKKAKMKKVKLILLVLLIAIILQLLHYFEVTVLKSFVMVIIFAFFLKFVYQLDATRAIILDFFYMIIELAADIVIFNSLCFMLGEKRFYSLIAGSLLGNIIVMIIMIVITLLVRRLIYKFLSAKLKYRLVFFLVFSVLCIISIFYATFKLGTNSVDHYLGFACIAIIVTVLCYSLSQTYHNSQLILEYDNLLSFIKKYEVEIDNQRVMRHETRNQLLTIKSKIIDREKRDSIVNYIDELINDDRRVKHSEYAKLKYLPSNGLKGLFYFKIYSAQEKGIKVGITLSKNIENSFLGDLDSSSFNQIGKILGVYLDNAIESAEISKEKMMGIEIFTKEKEIIIIISNSYDSSIEMFGRSSKGIGRGYGLILANNIINSNAKLNAVTEMTDNVYVKKLIIKK